MSDPRKSFTEQIETTGAQLIGQVKRLVEEGNARAIRIKEPDGDVVLEINLTVGAVAGGALALAAPWLAVIGAIAALAKRVSIEVVRTAEPVAENEKEPPHADAA